MNAKAIAEWAKRRVWTDEHGRTMHNVLEVSNVVDAVHYSPELGWTCRGWATPTYAECQGPDDPFCGKCRFSVHRCNGGGPSRAQFLAVVL